MAVLENRGTKVTFTVLAMDGLRIDRICMAIDRPEEESRAAPESFVSGRSSGRPSTDDGPMYNVPV